MRLICILMLCFAFGCSSSEQSAPAGDSLTTLDYLLHVDSASATTQHPLVCGIGRDFPAGRELAFINPQSKEFVHAVFPEGLPLPQNPKGKCALYGRYQTIQNRSSYTHKQPPDDYRYFVVEKWDHRK